MKTLRDILVAIKEPRARTQPALRKAAQLAEGCGARLTLFHALTTPLSLDAYVSQGESLQQVQKNWRSRSLMQLEKLAAPLREQGLSVEVASDWDFPAYEAVIRQAQLQGAELVVAERHATRHLLPWLLRFNDWELLRRSPVPVLLVKRGGSWKRPVILAAIDPTHDYAKPAQLDAAIMDAGNLVARALEGKLNIAHAWPGLPMPVSMDGVVIPAPEADEAARYDAHTAFDQEIEGAGLLDAKRHFIDGEPAEAITKLARRTRAGIIVMGALSRSGFQRLVVGNVAEQVLDAVSCDVLVMKPAEFKARVKPKRRGVQLIPTPAYV